jgi:integrase/recombinase XerD
MNICVNSKKRKLWVLTNYLRYLEEKGIVQTIKIGISDAHSYLISLTDSAPATKRIIATTLRESYDWMYREKLISFSGRQAFPLIRKDPRNKLLSYYSKQEIEDVLSCINTDGVTGKTHFLIVSLIAHLGIRVGDVINLKFNDIDWNNRAINIIQNKTNRLLTIPLVDEVKYPLIDYIKNARHDSEDKEHVLITAYAPYTKFNNTSSIFKTITKCMKIAGIQYEGRHHGPHALRHSLATSLMNENVPLSAISNIMGHSSTRTTEIYLTVDETNLKELSLEIPDVLSNA